MLKEKDPTLAQFRKALVKAVQSGAVSKGMIAKEAMCSMTTVNRWLTGTQKPRYRLIRRELFVFARVRMAAQKAA